MDAVIPSLESIAKDCEQDVVPYGISPLVFEEETRILDGGIIDNDDGDFFWKDRLALATRFGRGAIPSSVTTSLQSTPTTTLTIAYVHRSFRPTFLCGKVNIMKKTKAQQIDELLQDSVLRERRLLYQGIQSWGYVPFTLSNGFILSMTIGDEFGRGVYLTDDLTTALLYARQNGVFFVFEWIVDELSTYHLHGSEWQRTVKGHICFDIEEKASPLIFYNLDMLIGSMSANYDAIRTGSEPIASTVTRYATISDKAAKMLPSALVAIIYLE